jgi:2-amino-4-hydroxy-6-hydroxymethyldihydropteridine diphosphokinase
MAYIGLGSNLNDPHHQIALAFKALDSIENSQVIKQSSYYLSEPMGPQDQNNYINAVAKITTHLSAIELLDKLQAIEKSQGRVRTKEQWGARTLDLDLLLYGNHNIRNERLTIPHYGLKERTFVLFPLVELSPQLSLPDGSKIKELINALSSKGIKKL